MRLRQGALIITLPLAAWATAACAECAWVYWLEAAMREAMKVRRGRCRDGEREKPANRH